MTSTLTRRRVLTASSFAHRLGDTPTSRPPSLRGGSWQKTAWDYYNTIGELHYAATYIGRGLSMARLFVAETDDNGNVRESETPKARQLSRALLGGPGTAPGILRAFGIQRTVAGQSLITVHDDEGWRIYPNTNYTIRSHGGRVSIRIDGNKLPDGTLAIQLWNAHPGDIHDIDSPVRAALPILQEISSLVAYTRTTLLSRLATAGILEIPEGASYPELDNVPEDADPFMHLLQAAMETAIADPDSAAARVPITVEVPEGQQLRHLTLEYPLSDSSSEKLREAIRRLAMSMDMPPEILTGMSTTNRSTAWQIDEAAVKLHIEPALLELTQALTTSLVKPLLGDQYFVDYDLSELKIRPDRSEAALALYDRGEIDGEALREETGLRDFDPPTGPALLEQLAKAAIRANPGMLVELAPVLAKMGIEVPGETVAITPQHTTEAPKLEPAPQPAPDGGAAGITETREADIERPNGTHLATANPTVTALAAACDVVVLSTLGTAGKRWVKARSHRHKTWSGTDPTTIYLREQITADCLKPGETERARADRYIGRLAHVDMIAARHGADPDCVRETVREYIASLMLRQRPHEPTALVTVLAGCVDA